MKRKNKFAIGFWIMSSISVALVITLVGVLAAFTATSSSGFRITYTAGANVEATITAKYSKYTKNGTKYDVTTTRLTYSDGNSDEPLEEMTFNTNDADELTEKTFSKPDDINIEKDDFIVIHYTIKNNSTKEDKALGLTGIMKELSEGIKNIKVECAYYIGSDPSVDFGWPVELNDTFTPSAYIPAQQTYDIYIKISVNKKAASATFDGLFEFSLTVIDMPDEPQGGA